MQVKKHELEPDMEQRTGLKLGKVVCQGCILPPAYLTSMQTTLCEMLGWMKHKLESRLQGEISVTSYADDTTPMAESKEELKSLLMKVKDESEKAGLQHSKN